MAALRVASGPAEIERENRGRRVTIYAQHAGRNGARAPRSTRFEEILAEAELPPGYAGEWGGATERMQDTAAAVGVRVLAGAARALHVLACQFESFLQPLVIMLSAPLSFVGAFVALRLTGTPIEHLRADRL